MGKTAVADALEARGFHRVDLMKVAETAGALETGSQGAEVDLEALAAALPANDPGETLVESTWAHRLPVNAVVVLRCSPAELRARLAAKAWSEDRIRVAMEAEAVDVIAVEVLETGVRAWEVDTTSRTAEAVADEVARLLRGEADGPPPGTADWSEEVLAWY